MVRFIWDENKNRANMKKHAIDFNDAVRAWYDPNRIDFFDDEHSQDEARWIFLGAVAGVVLFVVETEPDKGELRCRCP
ncbi:MAG: BrnT family toxin [Treponema sp.]|nr:BrnT family toxin [Treponema sp.]